MPEISKITKVVLALAMPTSLVLIYWLYTRLASSDEESYGRQRVVTTKHTIIEVTVPKKAVGAVIGRQGMNIKQIQETSGARLHFKDDSDGDRILLVKGTAESAQQAELMVLQTIANVPEVFKEEIQVPVYSVGLIIGKGGATIQDIQRSSGCRIQIQQGQAGNYQDARRVITLIGTRAKIDNAVEMIEEMVIEASEKKSNKKDNSNTPKRNTKWERGSVKASAVPAEDDCWDKPNAASTPLPVRPKPVSLTDGYFEVYVSAVEHPGHFWVQVIGKEALQLEQLQQELTQWLSSESVRKDMALFKPTAGEMVAAKFEEGDASFYRAKVLDIVDGGKIDLYFVDYGDNAFADPGNVFKLRPDFLSLSYQAVECHLARVEPVGASWTDEAITMFEDLVYCAQWKSLVARVVTYIKGHSDGEDLRPSIQLFDTNGPKDVDIGEELVRHSHARLEISHSSGEVTDSSSDISSATPTS